MVAAPNVHLTGELEAVLHWRAKHNDLVKELRAVKQHLKASVAQVKDLKGRQPLVDLQSKPTVDPAVIDLGFDVVDGRHVPTIKVSLAPCHPDDNEAWKARDVLGEWIRTIPADAHAELQATIDRQAAEIKSLKAGGQVTRGELERLEEFKRQVRWNRR